MPDYLVKQPLKFDSDDYDVGETVTMDAKQAKSLLEIDALESAAEAKKPEKKAAVKAEKPTDGTLNAAIVEAIAGLDVANEKLWTQTAGVPQTAALSAALGYAVTATERDAALVPVEKPSDAVLFQQIINAVASLDKDDADLWTNSGKAQVAAIEAVLGFGISAKDRDAALAWVDYMDREQAGMAE